MQHNFYYPNPDITIQQIRFITICSNPLYIGNIQPYNPLAKIYKVTITQREIIHHLIREVKNNIMGRTITDRNTIDPRAQMVITR